MEELIICGERLLLHPFRAVFWEAAVTLLIADAHFGKARHFRRAGFAVPRAVADADWDRLISLLIDFQPRRVLFLGDLFHSDYNPEWEELEALTRQFESLSFELVRGNHDILSADHYRRARLLLHEQPLAEGPFLFSHHPLERVPEGFYNLAGHLHPAVLLRGAGYQRQRLPCFCFGSRQGVLPAFGGFTGMGEVEVDAEDRVFVVVEGKVIEV